VSQGKWQKIKEFLLHRELWEFNSTMLYWGGKGWFPLTLLETFLEEQQHVPSLHGPYNHLQPDE